MRFIHSGNACGWLSFVFSLTFFALACATDSATLTTSNIASLAWDLKTTNSTQQFRGLAPVSDRVCWVSGTKGTVLRTINGGATWANVSPALTPEDAITTEFRDIHAFSPDTAVVLSIGEGNASRIYRTDDGGRSWHLTFVNSEPTAFYDCMAFQDTRTGLAMSDPVDSKFRILRTDDGGANWTIVPSAGMPAALAGEFGFAASGTCLTAAAGRWYLASGGIDPGRIFASPNGVDWHVSNSSIDGGEAGGVFSVQFRNRMVGVAVGGDYQNATKRTNNAAWSEDGGLVWNRAVKFPAGYRSAVSWIPGVGAAAVAVGTTGSDITFDGGRAWFSFDNGTFDAVQCLYPFTCWASGSKGRVARLTLA
ncbi:oxidoreductase [Dendryphion nanum]|uniref:Oxidoreductase n=1 Tax=Dendryphion nanum TaxID=256645 RepID=A0A9P9D251_9PLEO|nr:oxidoreductase [Dendryphion nanum]